MSQDPTFILNQVISAVRRHPGAQVRCEDLPIPRIPEGATEAEETAIRASHRPKLGWEVSWPLEGGMEGFILWRVDAVRLGVCIRDDPNSLPIPLSGGSFTTSRDREAVAKRLQAEGERLRFIPRCIM